MAETKQFEISFETGDPALVEELLGTAEPNAAGEVEIVPGVLAKPSVEGGHGMIGTELLATIAVKVVEGVATKLLVDFVVMLAKKYGAKLKINGKSVAGEEQAVAAEISS
jgi:hypothetical protein